MHITNPALTLPYATTTNPTTGKRETCAVLAIDSDRGILTTYPGAVNEHCAVGPFTWTPWSAVLSMYRTLLPPAPEEDQA